MPKHIGMIATLAMILCILPGFAVEVQAGIWAVAQVTSAQATEAADTSAPTVVPLAKKVFTPKYSPISDVRDELAKLKSDRGKIVAIGNDIYVEDEPGAIAAMTQIFMRLDRNPKRQILIEASIVEASPSFVESLEIEWNTNSAAFSPDALTLAFGFLNKRNTLLLNATINASDKARTISAPRIMSTSGQEVSIRPFHRYWSSAAPVIEEPFKVTRLARETPARLVKPVLYVSGSSRSTAANVHFSDIAAELKIKPNVEDNSHNIALDIKLVNDTPDSDTDAIHTEEAKTKLVLKDGETVVIGGIMMAGPPDSENSGAGSRGLSIMDWVFNGRSNENPKRELLIFITATIIPVNI